MINNLTDLWVIAYISGPVQAKKISSLIINVDVIGCCTNMNSARLYRFNSLYVSRGCTSLYHPYQLKHVISRDVQGLHGCMWYKIGILWLFHMYVR